MLVLQSTICTVCYTWFGAISLVWCFGAMTLQQTSCGQNNLYNTCTAILVGFKPFILVSTILEMYETALNNCTPYTLIFKMVNLKGFTHAMSLTVFSICAYVSRI